MRSHGCIPSVAPWIAIAAVAAAACSGTIEPPSLEGGGGPGGTGGSGRAPTQPPLPSSMPPRMMEGSPPLPPPEGPMPTPMQPPEAAAPSLTGKGLQRLSLRQVTESFKSIGVPSSALEGLGPDERPDFLNALDAPFDVQDIELIDRFATAAMPTFEAKYGAKLDACAAASAAARAGCVALAATDAAIDLWGIRPADGGAGMADGYIALSATRGETRARALLFRSLATDPEFLFLVRAAPSAKERDIALFKRWASYTLTRSPRAAANSARATTPVPISEFVHGLVFQGHFKEMAFEFYQHLLRVEPGNALVKDLKLFPYFTGHFISGAVHAFRDHMFGFLDQSATPFMAPLWGPVTLTRSLPEVYTAPAVSAYGRNADARIGAFAHPAALASLSANNDTVPLHNGVLFLDKLLCQLPPPPPVNPDEVEFHDDPKKSRRDNFEVRTSGPACKGCHQSINPVSFAFEMFDATGRLRPDQEVAAFPAGGQLIVGNRTITFANGMDLVKQLDGDPQVVACHVQRWTEHLNGGPLDAEQVRALEPALQLAKAGGSLRNVVKTIVLEGKFN